MKSGHWDLEIQAGESKYLLVDPETREKITRVRNIVVALGNAFIQARFLPPPLGASAEARTSYGFVVIRQSFTVLCNSITPEESGKTCSGVMDGNSAEPE